MLKVGKAVKARGMVRGKSATTLSKLLVDETTRQYFCRADAEQAALRVSESVTQLPYIETSVCEKVRYGRGRPKKDQPRNIASEYYVVDAKVQPNLEHIEQKRKEAGCFVLLCNDPLQGETAQTGADLLRAYKEQYGIEHNFSFLKDPLIVGDMFLKKPERIEVLGAILLMALLIWNLIEHVLRQHVLDNDVELPGWDNKKTRLRRKSSNFCWLRRKTINRRPKKTDTRYSHLSTTSSSILVSRHLPILATPLSSERSLNVGKLSIGISSTRKLSMRSFFEP